MADAMRDWARRLVEERGLLYWLSIATYIFVGSIAAVVCLDIALHLTDRNEFHRVTPARLLVAAIALVVGIGLYLLREYREKYYAATEVIVGMAAASLFVQQNPDTLVGIIALAGGIRIIVDGLKRLFSP